MHQLPLLKTLSVAVGQPILELSLVAQRTIAVGNLPKSFSSPLYIPPLEDQLGVISVLCLSVL
jgi:hypothetical protein